MKLRPGLFTERLFSKVMLDLGYENLASSFPIKKLRSFLLEKNPQRLQWLDANYGLDISSAQIVDYAYGIDYAIEVEPTKQLVGFDFTINPLAIDRKVDKLKRSKFLWSALGIERVVVVCFDLPKGEDQGLLFYDTEECSDLLLDVIYSAIEAEEEVLSVTIKVNRK